MSERPYTPAELAALLGHSTDWLYRNERRLVAEGMPRRICPFGRARYHRAAIDAWLGRSLHPLSPTLPANDAGSVPINWQIALAEEYGRG